MLGLLLFMKYLLALGAQAYWLQACPLQQRLKVKFQCFSVMIAFHIDKLIRHMPCLACNIFQINQLVID